MSEERASRQASTGFAPESQDVIAPPGATDAAAGDGPLIVEGCAGSGKTTLLGRRFSALVDAGVLPDRIACITPTDGRADALRGLLERAAPDGYSELVVGTPVALAAAMLRRAGRRLELADAVLGPGDRLALLAEQVDELPLVHHDFAGNARALLGGFVRRIDRLAAEGVSAGTFARWAAAHPELPREQEFAEIYAAHDRIVQASGGCDAAALIRCATDELVRQGPRSVGIDHVLIDDAQELDELEAAFARALGPSSGLAVFGDPIAAVRRYRGAGVKRLRSFDGPRTRRVVLTESLRCPSPILDVAWAFGLGSTAPPTRPGASDVTAPSSPAPPAVPPVRIWRAANERAQAQAVAAAVEQLLATEDRSRIAVLVPQIEREGQAVAVALEERAVPHRLVGEAAFLQRAEIRDLLAWLRLLADAGDAPAAVRALARPPIELRSVDIARVTQIARRRKLDMVAALVAATESPQVPPEARERIRVFLKLYRASAQQIDTSRPDLYLHRLIERLGLRRQQLFAAQADAVERLRALARFGDLATAHLRRAPLATARDFARSIAAIADHGLRELEEPDLGWSGERVQILAIDAAGGLEADHVFVAGLYAGFDAGASEPDVPADLIAGELPAADELGPLTRLRQRLYVAASRARRTLTLSYPATRGDRDQPARPHDLLELARLAAGVEWDDRAAELFGPAESLHATYRLLLEELVEGTVRAGGRLAELRFDTDLDVSHAVVRYLELLKVAALIAREDTPGLEDALRDVNTRIGGAITAEQREILGSTPLDDYLLDAARDARRRGRVIAARDEPSLERFLPLRGDGVVLSASDIDTYRACPLRYKFARVFRIPQEPTLHQRFGIAVHQVLERFHVGSDAAPEGGDGNVASSAPGQIRPLGDLLDLFDVAWRRQGFGDSGEERQLRGKAVAALTRYHDRASRDTAEPVWFERQFSFRLGPNLLRGRVDRVDRLPGGGYELIDYKTGRPKSADQLRSDVQLSLYTLAAREAWGLGDARGAYWYVLDDVKSAVPGDADWIGQVVDEVAGGIRAQEFEPTPSASACGWCDYRLACPAAER